ncbi:MAG: hypothetical protein ABW179_04935 [Methylobacterium sp.]
MRSAAATDNVIPFRRPAGLLAAGAARSAESVALGARGRERAHQRSLMDAVYATGTLMLAADDRDTKLVASRLQVYGFLTIEEVGADGAMRRLRPSEAIRARSERPWRLSKASYGASLAVSIPSVDDFLFETAGMPA